MKNLNILALIIILFSFISCEKEIEFKGEIQEKKVVLNSFVTADSIITAELFFSKFFLDNNPRFDTIKNAQVELYVNGSFQTNLIFKMIDIINLNYYGSYILQKGVYTCDFIPQAGDSLKLIVNVPGYDEVSASTVVPKRANIDLNDIRIRIDTIDIYESTYYNDSNQLVTYKSGSVDLYYNIKFIDNADEQNIYRIVLKNSYGGYEYIESEDPVFKQSGDEGIFDMIGGYSSNIFTDETFNGETRSVSFNHYYWFNSDQQNSDYKYLDIQQLSKEAYLYIKTTESSDFNEGNIFSEPVLTYSNIKGGIGIFASVTKLENPIKVNLDFLSK